MENSKPEKRDKIQKVLIILLPILLTISLILTILLHLKHKNEQSEDEPYNEVLTSINFKEEGVMFNDNFSFIGDENDVPDIVIGQGLELENTQTGIKIKVPSYKRKISLEVSFTNFQQKTMIIDNPEQKSYKVDYVSNNQAATLFEFNTSPNTKEQLPLVETKNVEFLLFSFQNPTFLINNVSQNGFLFIGEIILSEIS